MSVEQRQADFAYCKAIIKQHSTSFYYAFSQLPREKANAVYAIYAFCRTADDIVDSPLLPEEKSQELHCFKSQLDLFRRNAEPDHPLWRALRVVFSQYGLDIEPFYDQLAGQFMDLRFAVPGTLHELENYSYCVAGSVGLMLLPILAARPSPQLRKAAVDLGIAMQLTNILRDVGEDLYAKQRIYLPAALMKAYRYSQDDLQSGLINDAFIQIWERIAARAEALYDRFSSHIELFDADSRIPLLLSAQVYRGILGAVRDSGYNCFFRRNYMSVEQMGQIGDEINYYS